MRRPNKINTAIDFILRRAAPNPMKLHDDVAVQKQTCYAYPESWRGTLANGRSFHFRYRYGKATLVTFDDDFVPTHAAIQHGDDLRGVFDSDAERQSVFKKLWEITQMGMQE